MDPRQSNVGEAAEGFIPGGNNAGWLPQGFMYGYQTPAGWLPQGFQPIGPNVQMMTPNSYAPQSVQPAEVPEASKHIADADVEEVAAPAASTGKRKSKSTGVRTKLSNFNAEDTSLVKSWLEISCDPITSTGQKSERLWERILERYNFRRGSNPERSVRSLQSRWDIIKAEVALFAAYYADSIRENPSGMSDADKDEPKWQDPQLRESAAAAQGEGFVDDSTQGAETVGHEQGQSGELNQGGLSAGMQPKQRRRRPTLMLVPVHLQNTLLP